MYYTTYINIFLLCSVKRFNNLSNYMLKEQTSYPCVYTYLILSLVLVATKRTHCFGFAMLIKNFPYKKIDFFNI